MNKRINEFIRQIENADVSNYQRKIIEEYIDIGDHELYGGKHSGSDAEHKGAEYIAERLRELNLDNVEIIPVKADLCQFNDAELVSVHDPSLVIKPYGATTVGTDGLTTEIMDLGTEPITDDVKGKIILLSEALDITDACPHIEMRIIEAAKRGAAAVLVYLSDEMVAEDTISVQPTHILAEIPVLSISRKSAEQIRSCAGAFHLTVDCQYIPDGGTAYEVVAEIKGSVSDERIIYSAHLDHFFKCIQDNVSAVSTLLGIAKIMKDSEYRPNRTITFIFNGAHEIGHINAATTDLKGAYELLVNERPDLLENTIANINFEYTAMEEHELRAYSSYEMQNAYLNFIKYMPNKMPGFEKVANDVSSDDYFLGTWTDAAIFMMNGVPFFMNDSIRDQLYTGDSPYMGRDHSNKDNWEIFSEEALRTNTIWYGSLGAYLDNTPVIELNFAKRMEAIQLTDDEMNIASAASIDGSDLRDAIERIRVLGAKLYREIYVRNMKLDQKIDSETIRINKELMRIYKTISAYTDQVTAQLIGIIGPQYRFYLANLSLMQQARELLMAGQLGEASNILCEIDLASVAYYFDKTLAEDMAALVGGEATTWSCGKVGKCFTLSKVMELLKNPERIEAAHIVCALDEGADRLAGELRQTINETVAGLQKAENMISDCLQQIMLPQNLEEINEALFPAIEQYIKWIKGFTKFPHRMTGTKEGMASAQYVKEMFEEIGLSDVHIESADSLCSRVENVRLEINGKNIDAYVANGTNRTERYGVFDTSVEAGVVYLRRGQEADFKDVDVTGKIVLCEVNFLDATIRETLNWRDDIELYDPCNMINTTIKKKDIFSPNDWPANYFRAVAHGAAGFVGILNDFMDCNYHHEDYAVIMEMEDDFRFPIPGLWISKDDGEAIKALAGQGSSVAGRMTVRTTYEMAKANNVVGVLPGKTDEIILVHSHHDAVCEGAVQDASGMSEVFAIAEYFARLPLEQREKTMMFAGLDSHYTDYEGHVAFMNERKQKKQNIILDIALEHIAKEMDLGENNRLIVNDQQEVRLLYAAKQLDIFPQLREMLSRNGLDKTIIIPADHFDPSGYKPGAVCSDATVSWENGIPIISIIAAPMYLYHNSDNFEKVHIESLRPIGIAFSELIMYLMKR